MPDPHRVPPATEATSDVDGGSEPPQPGAAIMPRWDRAELDDAPAFNRRCWALLLGPALISGGAAIGGGEWLMGPAVTARYGAAILWLATLSIVGQVAYNLEISRYTLYCGEPIFTGKFRTLPGPRFWLLVYLALDFGAVFPYLASNAATPLAMAYLGRLPDARDAMLMKALGIGVFLLALVPALVGGQIYQTLKWVMGLKIVAVLGFLLLLAAFFSTRGTWIGIVSGFFKFGTVPVGGDRTGNVFVSLASGRGLPAIDLSTVALLAAFAAIAGNGGLTNAPLSNYTRDQGWGMGRHVGAIPSIVGGRELRLSHVGAVFEVDATTLPRWRRWYRHLVRDQLVVWAPACFLGAALPSLLSLQFLPRGTRVTEWAAAGMTAAAVGDHVGVAWGLGWGTTFWYLTLLCGFLTLGPTMAVTVDGFVRRWVDVFWTASHRLRCWDPARIRRVYFAVLVVYAGFGVLMLWVGKPLQLVKIATNLMNYALGFSCWHTLYVNLALLPEPLRPGWFMRVALAGAGLFFLALATITTLAAVGLL
ncbi:Nramp family divalent metal transporter [Tautonia plasticadhaerens]|uniref:Natural resistance-associated macrophage protein n=1 Tax=Tautonia plasticadhaerens TaxID=2527974 RepID=A0A518HEX0_9BACT|nr:Nramp family divalent metal transporter [Tautonia plasticadhaerens]QDV39381.1 hypothetical protein ElP_73470 [Tautonia plasticadhaerens]